MPLSRLSRMALFGVVLVLVMSACAITQDQNLELTQSISGEMFGGTVELHYPAGWGAVVENNTIRLASQESFLTGGVGVRHAGDMVGGAMPLMKSALFTYGLNSHAAMTDIARVLAADYGQGKNNLIISSPAVFTVGDQLGAVSAGTARGTGDSVGRMAVAVFDLGDAVAVVTITEFGDQKIPGDYARVIAESLTFTAG